MQDSIVIWRDIVSTPNNEKDRQRLLNVQLVLRVTQTGEMDNATIVTIRGTETLLGLKPTGVIDKTTYDKFMKLRWVEEDEG